MPRSSRRRRIDSTRSSRRCSIYRASRAGPRLATCSRTKRKICSARRFNRSAGRLDGRELRIDIRSDESLLFGRFDFAQTLRALVNLIENAAKYSPPGSAIDLSAFRETTVAGVLGGGSWPWCSDRRARPNLRAILSATDELA